MGISAKNDNPNTKFTDTSYFCLLFYGTVAPTDNRFEFATFDVLAKAHGRGDRLTLVVALLFEDFVVAGQVVQAQLFPPLLLLVSGRQLLGEGEHGEDDEQHGHGAQQEPAPPTHTEVFQRGEFRHFTPRLAKNSLNSILSLLCIQINKQSLVHSSMLFLLSPITHVGSLSHWLLLSESLSCTQVTNSSTFTA